MSFQNIKKIFANDKQNTSYGRSKFSIFKHENSSSLCVCVCVLTVLSALLGASLSGDTSVALHAGQVKSFSQRCS